MSLLQHYSLKRLKNLFFLYMANLPMPGHAIRPWLVKMGGVNIKEPNSCFIGKDVGFDTVAPQRIHIGKESTIAAGTAILTHYQDSKTGKWYQGDVFIGENVFIGMRTLITKTVKIGNNVMIGAGSIITKDIPSNEVWAGNPARFIRKREIMK